MMTEEELIAMNLKTHEAMMDDIRLRIKFSTGIEKRDRIRIVLNVIEVIAVVLIAAKLIGA